MRGGGGAEKKGEEGGGRGGKEVGEVWGMEERKGKEKEKIIIIKIKNLVSCHQIVQFSPAFLLWGCENVFYDRI